MVHLTLEENTHSGVQLGLQETHHGRKGCGGEEEEADAKVANRVKKWWSGRTGREETRRWTRDAWCAPIPEEDCVPAWSRQVDATTGFSRGPTMKLVLRPFRELAGVP